MEKINENLSKKIENHLKTSKELKSICDSKGKFKLEFIYDLVDNKIEMPNDDPKIYLEIYTYFIRMRRFIFKWTNYIEDNLTSVYSNSPIFERKNIKKLCSNSFGEKINIFFKNENFFEFYSKNKNINKIKDFKEYGELLEKINDLRNLISHIDLFFLQINNKKKTAKILKISEIKNLIKYFLPEKMSIENKDKKWKAFDEQWKDKEEKFEEITSKNKPELIKIIEKIINLDFSLINFFE